MKSCFPPLLPFSPTLCLPSPFLSFLPVSSCSPPPSSFLLHTFYRQYVIFLSLLMVECWQQQQRMATSSSGRSTGTQSTNQSGTFTHACTHAPPPPPLPPHTHTPYLSSELDVTCRGTTSPGVSMTLCPTRVPLCPD